MDGAKEKRRETGDAKKAYASFRMRNKKGGLMVQERNREGADIRQAIFNATDKYKRVRESEDGIGIIPLRRTSGGERPASGEVTRRVPRKELGFRRNGKLHLGMVIELGEAWSREEGRKKNILPWAPPSLHSRTLSGQQRLKALWLPAKEGGGGRNGAKT